MRIVIHQPQYFPYIGFFHKLSLADVYVVMDNTEFNKEGFIHRNKIITPSGYMWLTIPLIKESKIIKNIKINNKLPWRKKHLKSIECYYKNSPHFNEIFPKIKKIINKESLTLHELDLELIKYLLEYLGINIKIVTESSLKISGKSNERLINICKSINANTYISGPGSKGYIDENLFNKAGISLVYQRFEHPQYEQRFSDNNNFFPNMGIIDLLFNKGKESKEIIKNSGGFY